MKSKYNLLVIFFSFCALSPSAGYADEDDWDINTAYRLAVASDCSYGISSKESVRKCFKAHIDGSGENGKKALVIFQDLDYSSIDVLEVDDINAAILVKTGDNLIIAFRGTEPIPQDWGNNFFLGDITKIMSSLFKRELNKIYDDKRHEGFDKSLKSLTKKIEEVDNWKSFIQNPSGKTLYLTGHSKGGALATGATADYAKFNRKIVTYTFEAARFFTANGVISNSSNLSKIWRFEYQYDLVPHAPLGEVTYNYLIKERKRMLDLEKKNDQTPVEKSELTILKLMFYLLGKLGLPYDEIESNNFNFVSAGKLAYADSKNKLCLDRKCKDSEYDNYEKRFKESLNENTHHIISIHPFSFSIDQHSKGYLEFMKNEIK